jgi:hypothetical protein
MSRTAALVLLEDLTRLWDASFTSIGNAEDDLVLLKRFFDPIATGRRLRAAIENVKQVDPPASPFPPQLWLELPGRRWLITPEGRLAIDVLVDALQGTDDPVELEPLGVISAERQLLLLYRSWGRHRLDQVIKLQTGRERPLQVGPIALGLLLLVNRSTSEARALPCGPDDSLRSVVDLAVFRAVRAFELEVLDSSRGNRRSPDSSREKESLAGGWMPPELYRRFPFAIKEPRKEPQLLYVREGTDVELLSALTNELGRRSEIPVQQISQAFDAMVDSLRKSASTLASNGLAHERHGDTSKLKRQLLNLVHEARDDP